MLNDKDLSDPEFDPDEVVNLLSRYTRSNKDITRMKNRISDKQQINKLEANNRMKRLTHNQFIPIASSDVYGFYWRNYD